jgi:group I intron endonuclease
MNTIVPTKEDLERSGIYAIVNQLGVFKYVGQTKNGFRGRWQDHIRDLRKGAHFNPHLQNCWNKYGEANFKFVILEICQIWELDEKEQYWIDHLDPECNVIRNLTEWYSYLANSTAEPSYRKEGESFFRPEWHLWVYGGHKKGDKR